MDCQPQPAKVLLGLWRCYIQPRGEPNCFSLKLSIRGWRYLSYVFYDSINSIKCDIKCCLFKLTQLSVSLRIHFSSPKKKRKRKIISCRCVCLWGNSNFDFRFEYSYVAYNDTQTHTNTHMHTHKYTHTHTNTHIHTHTNTRLEWDCGHKVNCLLTQSINK